jgi:hypothetical protein
MAVVFSDIVGSTALRTRLSNAPSADGRHLAFSDGTHQVRVVDVETGAVRNELKLPYFPLGVAYVRDGRRYVTLRPQAERSVDLWTRRPSVRSASR